MNPTTTTNQIDDDELPSPPAEVVPAASEATFDSEIPAELFGDVPKRGEPIPIGTYEFRLDSFRKFETASGDNKGQPNFAIQWKCQEEPYTGRVVFENVPWVKPEDVKAASNQTDPRCSKAQKTLRNRLPAAKEIMEACSFKPAGKFQFEEFLAGHPACKLQLKLKERQEKTSDGKYKGTGEMGNEVVKHLSLVRPA